MLEVNVYPKAKKFISRVPPKHAKQLVAKIQLLRINPRPQDSKSLHDFNCLRADSGEYRIIYEIEGDTLCIILIGKRNDDEVYKQLDRL